MESMPQGIRNDMEWEGDRTRSVERCVHLAYYDAAEGAVPNFGMGVCGYVCSDHMHTGYTQAEWLASQASPPRPPDRPSIEKLAMLPHVDNLYLRVEWRDVQKRKGKLDLPPAWEWLLQAVEDSGKRWSFRVMNCSPHSAAEHSLPGFLAGRLPMVPYWRTGMPGPQPKYFARYSEEYLKWWQELLCLLGERFDAHPLLEYVDVSGFGLWGEGHHYASYEPGGPVVNRQCEGRERMEQVVQRLVTGHMAAFQRTPAVLSVHFTEYEAGRKAVEKGDCWMRSDSILPDFSTGETGAAMLAARKGAMLWETVRPGCDCDNGGEAAPQLFMRLPQRYFDIGGHYAAVGFNAWDAIHAQKNHPELYRLLEQRIGYRIRPAIIWRRILGTGAQEIVLGLVNDGCVPPPGRLEIRAELPGSDPLELALPEHEPAPGGMRLYALRLPQELDGAGPDRHIRLSMQIQIKGKRHRAQWAVHAETGLDPFSLTVPLHRI